MNILIVATAIGSVALGLLALKKLLDYRARTHLCGERKNVSPIFLNFETQDNSTKIHQSVLEEIQRLKTEYEEHLKSIDKKMKTNDNIADDVQILNDMWIKSEWQNSVVGNSDTDETYRGKTDDELIQETLKAIQRFSETLDRLSRALQEEEKKQQGNHSDELDI